MRRERLLFAELKREVGGVVSPEQHGWLDDLTVVAAGSLHVEVYLWKPSDLLNGTIGRVLR